MRKMDSSILAAALALSGAHARAGDAVAERASLTLSGAKSVAAAAVAEARKLSAPGGAIAVVDAGGTLLYLESLDGTFAAASEISIGKAKTAARFRKPTSFFEDVIKKGRTPMVALENFTPLQGGVPITVDGQVVGAIGVSGAASAQQDENIAVAGARGAMDDSAMSLRSMREVAYFDQSAVSAAFGKGVPLLDGEQGEAYKVHASRRDRPGMAEVHLTETDIIYVREGGATFVTGGQVVDGERTAPDEVRGPSIANGAARKLMPGDVIVVPRGTPHWFSEVSGTFTYFVVKVREMSENCQ